MDIQKGQLVRLKAGLRRLRFTETDTMTVIRVGPSGTVYVQGTDTGIWVKIDDLEMVDG